MRGVRGGRWRRPELIVLVRERPEESVLTTCKIMRANGGMRSLFNECQANVQVGCPSDCQASETRS